MSRIHQALQRVQRSSVSTMRSLAAVLEEATSDFNGNERGGQTAEAHLAAPVHPFRNDEGSATGRSKVTLKVQPDSKLVALLSPKSIPSEQYRTLKARLCQLRSQARLKSIIVTSAGMADGKSTTAINLAATLAHEIGAKVLLVDGDLRRPTLHSRLGVPQTPGIVDYLKELRPMEDVVQQTDFHGLYLVPGGIAPEQPAELLNSKQMTNFLQRAAEAFDWVIIDSPPVAALADAELLASKVDGVLFVVRAMHTPMDLLANAMDCLKDRNLLGIVLNCHEDFKMTKYSSYYNYEPGAGNP